MHKKAWCTCKVVVLLNKPIAFLPFSLLSPLPSRKLPIVGCYIVCTPCCMFETGQTFEPITPNISFLPWLLKRSTTMLDPFAQLKLFQHCWGHASAWHMVSKVLWVVSFPRCTAAPNIVGSCCIRLHTTANTDATTPNTVRPTMLGVVASVCTQRKSEDNIYLFI